MIPMAENVHNASRRCFVAKDSQVPRTAAKCDAVFSAKQYSDFCQLATSHGYKVVDVPGDGNCSLHAIVHQMLTQGLALDAKALRQQAVSFLRQHPHLLDESFLVRRDYTDIDTYLYRQSQDGEWVDELMIRAVGACINRNINVLHDNGHKSVLQLSETETSERKSSMINIGLIGEAHYVSLTNTNDDDNDDNDELPLPTSKEATKVDSDIDKSIPGVTGSDQNDWPIIWSEEAWREKREKYKFLVCNNGRLGCSSCRAVSGLQAFSAQGRHLAVEWVKCLITANGKGRCEQLTSLRKKIFEHSKSSAHISAETISREKEEERMKKLAEKMSAHDEDLTCKSFRTAYHLAKRNRPFSDYQSLLELQELNGANVGIGLRSRYSATEILMHVSEEMRRRACKQVIVTGRCFSVLVDESTTVSNKSTLIVYLKCISNENTVPHLMFLQLLELDDQKATTITQALLNCLHHFGFTDDYMRDHLVAFVSDGASVMTGRKSGVAAQLTDLFPKLVTWHCLNHRLELAVGDAADEVQGVSHFRIFMDSLYTLYSRSPKTQKHLQTAARELDIQVKKIGRVLSTRWVASSFRTVTAVWDNFEALAAHFCAGYDPLSLQYDKSLASKHAGLQKKLCSPQFVNDLAVMHDTLGELSMLSEQLQNRSTTIPEADKLIRRSIRRIENMKRNPGDKVLEAKSIAESSVFGSTQLVSNNKHVTINNNQFLSSVANSLRKRLLVADKGDTRESTDVLRKNTRSLLAELSVMDINFWPSDMDIAYGETEIRQLCLRFNLPFASIRDGYCDYRDTGGRQITQKLKPLVDAIKTIPCSTSECERGFSAVNLIMTDLRSTLTIQHVSALLFIKLYGPPLSKWKPQVYVRSWLAQHRSTTDTRTRVAAAAVEEDMQNPDPLWDIL